MSYWTPVGLDPLTRPQASSTHQSKGHYQLSCVRAVVLIFIQGDVKTARRWATSQKFADLLDEVLTGAWHHLPYTQEPNPFRLTQRWRICHSWLVNHGEQLLYSQAGPCPYYGVLINQEQEMRKWEMRRSRPPFWRRFVFSPQYKLSAGMPIPLFEETIVTDHHPLIPILNNHHLDEIKNPQLQRLIWLHGRVGERVPEPWTWCFVTQSSI